MEASFSGAEKGSGNEATQEDTYTGEASFLCSSKTNGFAHITRICETLVTSKAFAFALDSRGRIYFEENSILKSELLSIDTTISGLGMSVNGHDRFLTTNPGDYNVYSLLSTCSCRIKNYLMQLSVFRQKALEFSCDQSP